MQNSRGMDFSYQKEGQGDINDILYSNSNVDSAHSKQNSDNQQRVSKHDSGNVNAERMYIIDLIQHIRA